MEDKQILSEIMKLTNEEERLYAKEDMSAEDVHSLEKIKVELDQCWDYLNQRRALSEAGRNPDNANLRPPGIVENFEQ